MSAKEVSSLVHLSAGATGGFVGTILTSPLELLKTRQQSTVSNYSAASETNGLGSTRHSAASNPTRPSALWRQYKADYKSIMGKEGGLRSLYKGLTPSVAAVVTSKGLFFFFNAKFRQQITRHISNQGHVVHLTSGTLAGVICALSMNPFWVVKTKLQLDEHKCSRSTVVQTVRDMWRAERHRAFFRGSSASIVGSLEFGIYFLLYEDLKRSLSKYMGPMSQVAVASMVSKIVASTIMYPTEVVRTRMREDLVSHKHSRKYNNLLRTCLLIYLEEGGKAFYGGWILHLAKTIPFTITTFLVYEGTLNKYQESSLQKY